MYNCLLPAGDGASLAPGVQSAGRGSFDPLLEGCVCSSCTRGRYGSRLLHHFSTEDFIMMYGQRDGVRFIHHTLMSLRDPSGW